MQARPFHRIVQNCFPKGLPHEIGVQVSIIACSFFPPCFPVHIDKDQKAWINFKKTFSLSTLHDSKLLPAARRGAGLRDLCTLRHSYSSVWSTERLRAYDVFLSCEVVAVVGGAVPDAGLL